MCEAERWAAELVAKENDAFNETLERIAKFAREYKEVETNRQKLESMPLEELLGKISDNSDQCVIYSLGGKDYFVNQNCAPEGSERISDHCRKCITRWLGEEMNEI